MGKENRGLSAAKNAKNDEFYTQFEDIQRELNAYLEYDSDTFKGKTVLLPCDDPEWSNFTHFFVENFDFYDMKKLISTSYAPNAKKIDIKNGMVSLFELNSPHFDETKTNSHGKIFTIDSDTYDFYKPYPNELKWQYLEGDGDFRSDEVCKLRDEADIIITNPPFSLFREFLAWIMAANKKFLIIGNINCITYKEFFPLLKDNKVWIGPSIHSGDRKFYVPDEYPLEAANCGIDERGKRFIRVKGVRWFTNLEHGRRHEKLILRPMAKILRFTKHREIRENGFQKYDNYDAIEVPYSDSIPGDYEGVMGVPITFLDRYCPEQFEIVGIAKRGAGDPALKTKVYTAADYPNYSDLNAGPVVIKDGIPKNTYPRILIRNKR